MLSKPISDLVEQFQKLPGIGPKSAQRITYYLLRQPEQEIIDFGEAIRRIKTDLQICQQCFNITETNPCLICENRERNISSICVVEEPLDLIAIEKTKKHAGVYHVLGGVINPLMGIGPEEIRITELLNRIRTILREDYLAKVELIIATNPSIEGEATAMYLRKKIKDESFEGQDRVLLSRIARGLPTGGDVEYADQITLGRALDGRVTY